MSGAAAEKILAVKYGESAAGDFQAPFDPALSVLENLEKIVPGAVEIGLLPPEADAKQMVVRWRGRLLDLRGNLGEQLDGMEGLGPLELLDARSKIRLLTRYRPDRLPVQSEVVEVSPVDPLRSQLGAFFSRLRDHRWLMRKKKEMGFRLLTKGGKVDLDASAAWQGIASGTEVHVEPRLVFGWPLPRLTFLWLVGSLCTAVVVGSAFFLLNALRNERPVAFTTSRNCILEYRDRQGALHSTDPILAGKGLRATLPSGLDSIVVLPEGAPAYSMRSFRLNSWLWWPKSVRLAPPGHAGARDSVTVHLTGHVEVSDAKLSECFVNGFACPEDLSIGPGFRDFLITLPVTVRGELGYRIEFRGMVGIALDVDAFRQKNQQRGVNFEGEYFRFDQSGNLTLTLPYKSTR